jgi:hypothetical protein
VNGSWGAETGQPLAAHGSTNLPVLDASAGYIRPSGGGQSPAILHLNAANLAGDFIRPNLLSNTDSIEFFWSGTMPTIREPSVGPSLLYIGEAPLQRRMVYQSGPGDGHWFDAQDTYAIRSADLSSSTVGTLGSCVRGVGGGCYTGPGSSLGAFQSGDVPAFARLDREVVVGRGFPTVVATARQNRYAARGTGLLPAVSISIGWVSDDVNGDTWFEETASLSGVRSSITPGLACKNGASMDCILAFVDPIDPTYQVLVKRFNIGASSAGTAHAISPELSIQSLPVNVPTNHRIAAFFQDESGTVNDLFWIVIRPHRTNQNLEAYYSPTGVTWTKSTSIANYSTVGPTASAVVFNEQPFFGYAR